MLDDLDMLRRSWVRSLRAAGKAAGTISAYNRTAAQFIQFLDKPRTVALDAQEEETPAQLLARMPVTNETSICRDHVAAYMGDVLHHWKDITGVARYSHLHVWFEWMVDQPDIAMEANPMRGLARPVPPEEYPPLVPKDAIQALLRTCNPRTFAGLRDEAIIRLFADTGMRVGELAGLRAVEMLDGKRVPHVDLDVEHVYIVGKGRRPRLVSFGAKTAVSLDRYFRARRKHPHHDSPFLWLYIKHQTVAKGLTTGGIRAMMVTRVQKADIGHIHPHDFRHAWADHQKRSGLERSALKNQGGWRTDRMVDRYGAYGDTDRALQQHRATSFGDEI